MKDGTIFPHFANHPKTLLETWQKLFALQIEDIYPGHGPKFKIEKAYPHYERWMKKLEL